MAVEGITKDELVCGIAAAGHCRLTKRSMNNCGNALLTGLDSDDDLDLDEHGNDKIQERGIGRQVRINSTIAFKYWNTKSRAFPDSEAPDGFLPVGPLGHNAVLSSAVKQDEPPTGIHLGRCICVYPE